MARRIQAETVTAPFVERKRSTLGYYEKKAAEECTYPGCPHPAGETLQCVAHAEKHRAKLERRRTKWERKGLCTRCGRKRAPKSEWGCAPCLIEFGRVRPVDTTFDTKRDRVRARTAVDADGRTRYRGQARRGRLSASAEDDADLRDAKRYIEKGSDGLAYARSEQVQALPRIQRDEAKMAALGEIHLGMRLYADVLRRNRFPMTSAAEALELEAEIAATERKIRR